MGLRRAQNRTILHVRQDGQNSFSSWKGRRGTTGDGGENVTKKVTGEGRKRHLSGEGMMRPFFLPGTQGCPQWSLDMLQPYVPWFHFILSHLPSAEWIWDLVASYSLYQRLLIVTGKQTRKLMWDKGIKTHRRWWNICCVVSAVSMRGLLVINGMFVVFNNRPHYTKPLS